MPRLQRVPEHPYPARDPRWDLGPEWFSDVESALAETFEEPVVGTSTVARVCEDTCERYRRWCERRLDEHDVVDAGTYHRLQRPRTARGGRRPWRPPG